MILIVCLDDRNGMLFNHRRLSQDKILRQHILKLTDGHRLMMNSYSAKQFESPESITADESFMENAGNDDYCFDENVPVLPYIAKIQKMIIYRWNRKYPYDMQFDVPLTDGAWKLQTKVDFTGNSHPKITEEVYSR